MKIETSPSESTCKVLDAHRANKAAHAVETHDAGPDEGDGVIRRRLLITLEPAPIDEILDVLQADGTGSKVRRKLFALLID